MEAVYENVLRDDREQIEAFLHRHFADRDEHGDLYDAMNYSLLAGGKRLRPVLALETFQMCGGMEQESVLPFACAVEMIHTYSLIHDDLPCMDDDDLRRGRPTNHKVYGEATALLAGDGLLTAAFETIGQYADRLPADRVIGILRALGTAAGAEGMVGGQVLDMAGEERALSLEEIEELQRLKTGALICASAEIGCIAAGGNEADLAAVRRYAQDLGLAFQIRDDILDVEGDEATLGKSVGSDARSGKSTFVSLCGLARCEELVAEKTESAKEALWSRFGANSGFLCALADSLVARKN